MNFARVGLALAMPLFLASCLLAPGQFTSTLDIRADRTFAFAYTGEVIRIAAPGDAGGFMGSEFPDAEGSGDDETLFSSLTLQEDHATESEADRLKGEAIAEALAKEVGYKSAEYLGNNKFRVDYAMSGRLDRNFIYPHNTDAEALFPWIAVEVRKDGTVRVKAPAFGEEGGEMAGLGGGSAQDANAHRQGTFTLTTDAELVMHNNEEGAADSSGKRVVWRVTPTSKTVPTAVIRLRD